MSSHRVVSILLLTISSVPVVAADAETRVRDLTAIERLRWSRRIAPGDPAARVPFETALPEAVLRERSDDALRKTRVLEERYGIRVTSGDLHAELSRMIAATKDPEALRAVFAALGDDPTRIAETIARPVIVDRRLRSAFANDERVHGRIRETAIAAAAQAPIEDAACPVDATCQEMKLKPEAFDTLISGLARGRLEPRPPRVSSESIPTRRWSDVRSGADAFVTWRIESRSTDGVRLTVASWRKPSFDAWWAEQKSKVPATSTSASVIGPLPSIPTAPCTPDTWSPMDPQFPLSREYHTAVWDGSEMLVWGGDSAAFLGDGWKYSPVTDTWSRISSVGAPTPRTQHLFVWTGTEMIVWGGWSPDYADFQPGTGGRYNPSSDSWSTITTVGAPDNRFGATAVWTGTEMIVWGGQRGGGEYLNDGARYSPANDAWTVTGVTDAPDARAYHSVVWTGTEMIVWGGMAKDPVDPTTIFLNTGGRYSPVDDSWQATRTSTAPLGRYGHGAAWTGAEMIVWGGTDGANPLNTGGRYRPSSNQWQSITTTGAPSARDSFAFVWTGSRFVVWAGYDVNGPTNSGGRYDPSGDAWQSVSTTAAPLPTGGSTSVWTGSRMITFGGGNLMGLTHDGGRYDPVADSWQPTATTWRPAGRSRHASVWTGNEMIVWGGYPAGLFGAFDAGRYEPSTDTWSPITTSGAPTDRWDPSTVWTGTQMLVWGGGEFDPSQGSERPTNGGGRYDPTLDTWSSLSATNQPAARTWHSTVWNGREMIVWGGTGSTASFLADGGRYRPSTDTWQPVTSLDAPSARFNHVAIWDGHEMIVARGHLGSGSAHGGARYDPDLDLWTPNSNGALELRILGHAAWSGGEMLVALGDTPSFPYRTAERYDPVHDAWSPLPSTDVGIAWGGAIWACDRLFVWGNRDSPAVTGDGRRLDLEVAAWSAISTIDAPPGCQRLPLLGEGTRIFTFGGEGTSVSPGGSSDTGGTYCGCTSLAALKVPVIFVDRTPSGDRVSWFLDPTATFYDVVRGDLGVLRTTGGNFAAATAACAGDDIAGSPLFDATAPGQGLFYLVRSARAAEASTYDSGSPKQVASRDAAIAASGHACP